MSREIGYNIKRIREIRGMSQPELAELLNVSSKTVSSWEVGRTEPKMGMVEKICLALHCVKSDIVGGDDSYYLDEEAKALAQSLFDNKDYSVLFDAIRKVKPEDIEKVAQMIKLMAGE